MSQGGYQQMPCARCGQAVWIEMTTRAGVCQSCGNVNNMHAQPAAMGGPPMGAPPPMGMGAAMPMGQPPGGYPPGMQPPGGYPPGMQPPGGYPGQGPGYPNQMPGQMPMQGSVPMGQAPMPQMQMAQGAMGQAPMPAAAPQMPQQPQITPSNPAAMYQNPRKHIAKGVVGAVAIAVLGGGGYYAKKKFKKTPGKIKYSSLGIDPKQADPDALIGSVSSVATKWNRDAAWWAVNVHGIKPDGTVDLTSGGTAQVTYISPNRVTSLAKSRRKDSIKKFMFGPSVVSHNRKWEPTKAWKDITVPGMPACGIGDLTAMLRTKGFKTGTLHVSFDPQFAFAVDAYAWSIKSEAQPELAGWYSMLDCSLLKKAK